MSKRKILIDVDLTICSVANDWKRYLEDRYGVGNFDTERYLSDYWVDYNLSNYVKEGLIPKDKERLDFWRQAAIYDYIELFDDCKDVINALHDNGDTVIFVSYCKAGHLASKWDLLRRNFPWVEDSPNGGFVSTKRKEFIDADVIIDDRNTFLEKHPAKIKIKYKTPYTQCCDLGKPHVELSSWLEIKEFLL